MSEKYSLKRCPCCGYDSVYARETNRIHNRISVGYVICTNCGLHTDFGALDSVVESWNRRRLYNDVPESYLELTDQYGRALKLLMEVDLDYLSKLLERVKKLTLNYLLIMLLLMRKPPLRRKLRLCLMRSLPMVSHMKRTVIENENNCSTLPEMGKIPAI